MIKIKILSVNRFYIMDLFLYYQEIIAYKVDFSQRFSLMKIHL